jgi:hypothetical protein
MVDPDLQRLELYSWNHDRKLLFVYQLQPDVRFWAARATLSYYIFTPRFSFLAGHNGGAVRLCRGGSGAHCRDSVVQSPLGDIIRGVDDGSWSLVCLVCLPLTLCLCMQGARELQQRLQMQEFDVTSPDSNNQIVALFPLNPDTSPAALHTQSKLPPCLVVTRQGLKPRFYIILPTSYMSSRSCTVARRRAA